MRKTIDYTIIRRECNTLNNIKEFENCVKEHLKLGWECQGGIEISSEMFFYQAMVKKK